MEKLVETAESNERAGIVAPLILYADEPSVVWSAGADFNSIIFKASIRGDGMRKSNYAGVQEVTLATGAAMLVRTKAIREIGLLDEKYFAYYEETKWQYEMKKRGWKIMLQPEAVVKHKIAASTGGGESPLSTYYLVRNRGLFISDECPLALKPIAYASLVFEVLARKNIAMAARGLLDFVVGKTGRMS